MKNLAKIAHFEKFTFVQQGLTQNMWSIEAKYMFLITSSKRFHSKTPSY
jgi:hypothetical protein